MKAIHLTAYGNPAQDLRIVEVSEPDTPSAGEALVRMEYAPIANSDLLLANGVYLLKPKLPAVIGGEGAGIVEAIGPGVTSVNVGDRVTIPFGTFTWSEKVLAPAQGLFVVPPSIDARTASILNINPTTAVLLLSEFVKLKPNDWIVLNAAKTRTRAGLNAGLFNALLTKRARKVSGQGAARPKLIIAPKSNPRHLRLNSLFNAKLTPPLPPVLPVSGPPNASPLIPPNVTWRSLRISGGATPPSLPGKRPTRPTAHARARATPVAGDPVFSPCFPLPILQLWRRALPASIETPLSSIVSRIQSSPCSGRKPANAPLISWKLGRSSAP